MLLASPFILTAQKVQAVPNKPVPTELILEPWIIGSETAAQWNGLLPTVNAPAHRSKAYPGQHLTLAVGAQGKDRDLLLREGTYTFTVAFRGAAQSFQGLHPSQTRRIKAEGADFVLSVLKEAKVDSGKLEDAVSMISLALFEVDWVVPAEAKDGTATFGGTFTSSTGKVTPLKDRTVEILSFDRIAKEGGFKDQKESNDWMMTYYQHPEPSRLLHALRMEKDNPASKQPNGIAFKVAVLKSSSLAAQDLLLRLKGEDRSLRGFALLLLSEAGYDLTSYLKTLTEEEQAWFEKAREAASALPDPYDLRPDASDLYRVTTRMDMLWSLFLVTGDQEPVRAVSQPLAWRDDWKVFTKMRDEYQKTGKRTNGMSIELVRAMAYGASGWSLGSFVRHHPLVTDFVEAWKQDATIPKVIQEELGTLITNPAFKRQ
ncbi:hypothetical protein [Mesoterricola silvestris]|nr:hypothetical protein [Mesoterricola silvestris]